MSHNSKFIHITKNNWTSEYLEFIMAINKAVKQDETQNKGIAIIPKWSFLNKMDRDNWFKLIHKSIKAIPNQHTPAHYIRQEGMSNTEIDILILLNTTEEKVKEIIEAMGCYEKEHITA